MLPPIALGAIALGVIALIKKKSEGATGNGPGGNGNATTGGIVGSGSKALSDAEYGGKDALIIGGSVLSGIGTGFTIAGGIAAATHTTVSSVFSAVGGVVSANPVVFIVVAVLVIIGVSISFFARLGKADGLVERWVTLLPNARHMHFYEETLLETFTKQYDVGSLDKKTVPDDRMRLKISRDYSFIGERSVHSVTGGLSVDSVSWLQLQKIIRALSMVYIFEQSKYTQAMLRNWAPKFGHSEYVKSGFQSNSWYWSEMYNDLQGYEGENLGGLNNLPLLGGYTEEPYVSGIPNASELRGVNTNPDAGSAIEKSNAAIRFSAFCAVLNTIQDDPGFYLPWDPNRYALDVYNRMELAEPYFVLVNNSIILPNAAWGFEKNGTPINVVIDIVAVKDHGIGGQNSIHFTLPDGRMLL